MKISVITPVYNQKDFLTQTIESVQKSVLAPYTDVTWEHLIYDDASTDGTSTLFTEHTWPNVFYYQGKENKGPSYARNVLIEKCTGDYIFMIDGDDIMLQRTLHNFIRCARQNPERTWFIGDFLRVDKNLCYLPGEDYYGWDFKNPHEMLAAIFRGEHFIQSNVFFKKDIFIEAGGFNTSMRMTEDLDLFIKFLSHGHMPFYCPFVTHLHRYHEANLSKGVDLVAHKEHMKELSKKYGQ